MRLKSDLPAALKYQAVVIESAAREAGLDFFDVVFELLPASSVNGVAAYGGFPVRYPSWRFGMEFERLQKGYRWGFSKIYELVINNDPTYAYLVSSNSLLEQKLVMAHVYGHADFFKHNAWFAPTDRNMVDAMGHHATRVRRIVDAQGLEPVERFLDLALSLDTLVDPYLPLREQRQGASAAAAAEASFVPLSERVRRALDALVEGGGAEPAAARPAAAVPAPKEFELPTHDVLGYLHHNAPLASWQRELLRMVRAEAYYFSPQRLTKVMNEGWASYWHSRLLTEGILEDSEILDFADCHSTATAVAPGQLNPYKLGIELFRYAEDAGEDVFQLRKVHKDVSLVHKLVDEEFFRRYLGPSRIRPSDPGPVDWREAKANLLQSLSWGGVPQIELVAVDAEGEGELLFVHHWDGRDLKLDAARDTMRNLAALWGGPVHLLTVEQKEGRRLVCKDGEVAMLDTPEARRYCCPELVAREA